MILLKHLDVCIFAFPRAMNSSGLAVVLYTVFNTCFCRSSNLVAIIADSPCSNVQVKRCRPNVRKRCRTVLQVPFTRFLQYLASCICHSTLKCLFFFCADLMWNYVSGDAPVPYYEILHRYLTILISMSVAVAKHLPLSRRSTGAAVTAGDDTKQHICKCLNIWLPPLVSRH